MAWLSAGLFRHPWARWAIPAAAATVAVGWASVATMIQASAEPSLPPRSAAQLLVDVQTARVTHGSGTVVQTADLGLPQLPSIGGAGSSDLTSLISGNHTLRVWYDGTSKVRLALMGTLGESDVILNGQDLWTWSSDSNAATHRQLDHQAGDPHGSLAQTGPLAQAGSNLTPQQVADRALAAIDPTTKVTTDGTAQVAGRAAYELVLAPKDTASLVGQVRIAVDAARHVPLRVQIFAKNATSPAAEVGFTQISFAKPNATQFTFTPPPGVKVTESASPDASRPDSSVPVPKGATTDAPVISGTGWTSVAQAKVPSTQDAGQLSSILAVLPRESGSWGSGRLLHSSLFNVLLTDDGRLLAGAVPAERLYQLAGQPLPAAS